MQKQNCLCVDDIAIVDHCQRFIERRLQDFSSFAFALAFAFAFELASLAAKKVSFSAKFPGFMCGFRTKNPVSSSASKKRAG
jgi:hypothetical protein